MLVFMTPIQANSSCSDNDVILQVLGSGGPELGDQRASSSYLIWLNDKATILVDTGAGSSLNFEKSGAKFEDLKAILFSHFHVDHSADFPAFIKGSFFTSRRQELPIYGPDGNHLMPSTSEFVQNLLGKKGAFRYLKDFIEPSSASDYHLKTIDVSLKPHKVEIFQLSEKIKLSAAPVHHGPIAAVAWRINIAGCSITFSGDMSNKYQTLAVLAKNTDILVLHNAIPEALGGVAARLHMPPSVMGEIAKNAQAKRVIISHRMLRTLGKERETKNYMAQSYSGSIIFANDLERFVVK
ncbi:MAG: MBL fold metallo-hydrolase [Methylophaga sp.]|nr:MAG: MBL fold metallo-hydrolase [Methylophaga sp.]